MLQCLNHRHGPSAGLSPVCPCPSCTGEPSTGPSTPGVASPVLSRGEGSPSLDWQCFASPGNHSPSLHKGTSLPHGQPGAHQDPQVLPRKAGCRWPPACPGAWGCSQDFALLLVELREVPAGPFLQPVEVLSGWRDDPLVYSHSSQFGVICKPAEDGLCPVLREQMAAWTTVLISMGKAYFKLDTSV